MFVNTEIDDFENVFGGVGPDCFIALHPEAAALVQGRSDDRGAGLRFEQCYPAREVKTCSSEDQLVDVMEVMTLQRIRHLPVIQNGALHGIISIGDGVKQRVEEVQSDAEELRRYIRSP
jgi:hypothetical protein